MLGSSRASFAEVSAALAGRSGDDVDTLSRELLSISVAIGGSASLRGALADSGTAGSARAALATSVFDGKVSAATVEVVADVVSRRWTSGRDLVDAVEALGIEAALIAAERGGRLDAVEDELFRVDRIVAGDDGLRQALSDPSSDAAAKAVLLGDLLNGRADEYTVRLVRHVVAHPRGRRLDTALADLVAQSARRRELLLAHVRVALPMTSEQERRLASALSRIYRHDVDLQVEVDPEVRGGVVVRIGDEVIDGSVAHRIDDLRRRLTP